MHECLLCERDMKTSKDVFGNGCINKIFNLLAVKRPTKCKDKEGFLFDCIMKKSDISKLNKKRQLWLADRYLTREYLSKLHYADIADIKEEIDRDIKNINKIKNYEELVTARKFTLKNANDLYKGEEKFNKNLEKLKNHEYKNDIELRLLLSGFSFIFNIYRYKNQYERDSFKKMQYVFWQTVIEVGREFAGFEISADFLQNSLEETPKDLFITKGKVIKGIKEDKEFNKKMDSLVKKYGKDKKQFVAEGEGTSMRFNNNDLYFSIHRASMKVEGKKNNGKWDLFIKLNDTYDYTDFKEIEQYFKDTDNIIKSMFSSTLYNMAYFSMRLGVMKEYKIYIQFEMNEDEIKL